MKGLKQDERERLLKELSRRYDKDESWKNRFTFFRKKYVWIFVVGSAKFFKRAMDILFSLLGLIVLSPLFLLIAFLIKYHDGGPIFYVTNRVGKWGKEFRFPKFRSMVIGAEKMRDDLIESTKHKAKGKSFKMKRDPRLTPIGYVLRTTSIDELPQLWCVLRGDMSLVGPRPPLPKEVELYSLEERKRLDITPGLTCIWQVSGRSEVPFHKQVKLDAKYIESQSVWLDIKILLKTVPAVLFGRGAY